MTTSWYETLSVARGASEAEIRDAVERLSRQATAMANTAPERSQALREQVRAIRAALLSGPQSRASYDATLVAPIAPPAPPPPPQPGYVPYPAPAPQQVRPGQSTWGGRLRQFMQTGWTCPKCGEGALPSEKFCPRCGVAIQAPALSSQEAGTPPVARPAPLCAGCGAALAPTIRFCTRCGRPRD